MLFKAMRNSLLVFSILISACGYPPLTAEFEEVSTDYTYIIGSGDTVNVFVWGHPDVTTSVPVRPDGKITIPLVEDILASGKTPYDLARQIEKEFSVYIREPQVYVLVTEFQGVDAQQIRIIGQINTNSGGSNRSGGGGGDSGGGGGAGGFGDGGFSRYSATSIPYERGMTLLDVIIAIGSIGEFADGNRASIIRTVNGEMKQYGVKIDDLAEDGDMTANVKMLPGDILVIPEAFF